MKRHIARLALLALLSLCLVGCADDDTPPPQATTTATVTTTTTAAPTTTTTQATTTAAPTTTTTTRATIPYVPGETGYRPHGLTWNHEQVVHNTGLDKDNNVFLDALVYTGYNLQRHRDDGLMWIYVMSKEKPPLGWLSNIHYGGGSSGLETTADGKPDIAHFECGGLVCASYVSYVYFNYLPHVAGIDTSMLKCPDLPTLADSWYVACQEWEKAGQSRRIAFQATGRHMQWERFCEAEEIPIGSILCFRDGNDGFENSTECTHVCIYAGHTPGNHWVYHVGNHNGPEFSAIERMLLDPHPQMMLDIFTTPLAVEEQMAARPR